MLANRSFPPGTIVPELVYANLDTAVDWLCRVFGFSERLRIGDHRSQLVFGSASVVAVAGSGGEGNAQDSHSVMVRVEDVDQHYEQSKQCGATVLRPPETYPYGERQYTAEDIGGHRWKFSQTIEDVSPEQWGGKPAAGYKPQIAGSRMDHLSLPVAQYIRSRDWYIKHLGLELEFEIPQHKTVALKDSADLTVFFYEKPDGQVAASCTLTFQVNDVEMKYQELSAHGVTFEKSPQKLFWGYGAELRDPDGYLIYLWDEKSMREKGN
jgi:uncharacterized glyoxalase superfamily protein PhnB